MADEKNTSILLPDRYRSGDAQVVSRLCDERDHRARAARCARRIEAGAAAHPGGHERSRPGLQSRLPQVRENLRRHFRQLPPARRSGDLSGAGAPGAGLQHALPADRRTGKFRLGRRRSSGGHAVHGSAAGENHRRHSRRPGKRNRRFHSQLRSDARRARGSAVAHPQSAGERRERHRRRHGHQHSAAQFARNRGRRDFADRKAGHAAEGNHEDCAGPGFSDRRVHRRTRRHRSRVQNRPRQLHDARQSRHRRSRQGPREHRHHRNSVPGEQIQADRAHRRTGAEQKDRRHRRRARRILARRHAHRHRNEARRRIAAHPEQSFQAHADAGIVRHDPAVDRRRAAARTGLDPADQAVHRAPRGSGAPPHRVRIAQSPRARTHFGGLPDRAGSSGRRDPHHSRIGQPRGSQGKPAQVFHRAGRHHHGERQVQEARGRQARRPQIQARRRSKAKPWPPRGGVSA